MIIPASIWIEKATNSFFAQNFSTILGKASAKKRIPPIKNAEKKPLENPTRNFVSMSSRCTEYGFICLLVVYLCSKVWIKSFYKRDKSHDSCSFDSFCQFLLVFQRYSSVVSWDDFSKFCKVFFEKFNIFIVNVLSVKWTSFFLVHSKGVIKVKGES